MGVKLWVVVWIGLDRFNLDLHRKDGIETAETKWISTTHPMESVLGCCCIILIWSLNQGVKKSADLDCRFIGDMECLI